MALISPIQTLWASVRASKRECRKLKMRESKFPSLRSGVFPTIMGQQPRDRANSSQFQRSGKRSFRRFRYGSLDQLVPNFKIQHGRDSPLSNFRIRKVTFTDLDSRDLFTFGESHSRNINLGVYIKSEPKEIFEIIGQA